ncbi:MAG: hypothetical protein H0U74_20290 [Bradymonadaceae bacterium]|nr:hypothetical protein [Lujinxingiaceae bacterium]
MLEKHTARTAPAWFLVALFVLCAWAPPAAADPIEGAAPSEHTLQAGLNLRTDFGVHAVRIDLGWTSGRLATLVVLDPMFWTDGQTSTDLVAFWMTDSFHPYVGWRLTTIPLLDGAQFQQNLLLGTGLALPQFFDGRVTGQWGIELAMMLVKHGGGLPAETISFASGRHYIDLVNFGMYVRFDYNVGL